MDRQKFLDQMWITYKARFNAHARLAFVGRFYTVIVAALSFFVLVINLSIVMPLPFSPDSTAVTFYTIALSILILVFGILFSSSDTVVTALRFHTCALEIKSLHSRTEILFLKSGSREFAEQVSIYNQLLGKYELNHEDADAELVRQSAKESRDIQYYFFRLRYFLRFFFPLWLVLAAPIGIGILLFF